MEIKMKEDLIKHGIEAFCEVDRVENIQEGIINVSKGHGIAGLKTNTILFGWSLAPSTQINQLKTMLKISSSGQNLILLKMEKDLLSIKKKSKKIDIWWRGKENNGKLMLLFAYLLSFNKEWEKSIISIKSVVSSEEEKVSLSEGIKNVLPGTRIKASIKILVQNDKNFRTILFEESAKADLVFLGLGLAGPGEESKTIKVMNDICNNLRSVAFVRNNSMADSLPILLKI